MQLNDNPNSAVALGWYARSLLIARKEGLDFAKGWAEAHRAPAVVGRLLHKGAMPAGTTADAEWGGTDYSSAQNAFLASLQTQSIYFRILSDGGFLRVPVRTRVGATLATATGWIIGEGRPVPLSRLRLANTWLTSIDAAALVVCTHELLMNVSNAGQILFNRLLKESVAKAVDQRFLEVIVDTDTTDIDSVGDDDEAIMADMRALLAGVKSDGTPSLYFIVAADVAKRAATFPQLFPAMTPTGGELVGLPAIVSNTVDDGTIHLVNAAAIAADADGIRLRTSFTADIEMVDENPTQDATTGEGVEMISMFQTNSVALMAIASFGVERLRDDAVAVLRNVNWGGGTA